MDIFPTDWQTQWEENEDHCVTAAAAADFLTEFSFYRKCSRNWQATRVHYWQNCSLIIDGIFLEIKLYT